jgi:hypothetical protein
MRNSMWLSTVLGAWALIRNINRLANAFHQPVLSFHGQFKILAIFTAPVIHHRAIITLRLNSLVTVNST